jgi:uncharacterized OsmC-like protein
MENRLAQTTVAARLVGLRGRAILTAKNHHVVVDSPLTLGGPNEELNPIDMLFGAVATHVIFVCERAAHENGFALTGAVARVSGTFDPHTGQDPAAVPYLQNLSVDVHLTGPTETQATLFGEAIRTRCLMVTTLARAVPIALSLNIEPVTNPT